MPSSHPSLGMSVFFLSFCHLEVLEVDILWPRWVARIGVTRATEACFLPSRLPRELIGCAEDSSLGVLRGSPVCAAAPSSHLAASHRSSSSTLEDRKEGRLGLNLVRCEVFMYCIFSAL